MLLTAAVNGLQVMSCDIQNAYLAANCREKIWTYVGPEFGSERGQPMIIRKALYGLKSTDMAFRAHLAETLHDIGFKPTKTDPEVWIHPAVKPDGSKYYEYIMCYVDDILSVSHDAKSILQFLQEQFKLKQDKVEPPDMYLGAQFGTMQVEGNVGWFMSSEKYVKSAIQNIEETLQKTGPCCFKHWFPACTPQSEPEPSRVPAHIPSQPGSPPATMRPSTFPSSIPFTIPAKFPSSNPIRVSL